MKSVSFLEVKAESIVPEEKASIREREIKQAEVVHEEGVHWERDCGDRSAMVTRF